MYSRTVEIDDEVFEYVQNHAEPLVDDFNSALKKLLGLVIQQSNLKKTTNDQNTKSL